MINMSGLLQKIMEFYLFKTIMKGIGWGIKQVFNLIKNSFRTIMVAVSLVVGFYILVFLWQHYKIFAIDAWNHMIDTWKEFK